MNRLASESSPYLRQHADNPVEWYPWGDEAFSAARERDVPILLSIGYSACHWCHVMAHESFEDPATASVVNDGYVAVKVDREERPDVDAVYMDATLAMTGSGGWPMTVFLDHDGRPFFAGTYFPKTDHHGRPSFTRLLGAVSEAWQERREELLAQAEQLTEAIRERAAVGAVPAGDAATVDASVLRGAYASLAQSFDAEWGGFGSAPKFPMPSNVELLARAYAHNRADETLSMLTTTLDAMAEGGIYDHLGGGFARYAVDRTWTVPHFEKMLYDNAQLLRVYLHGWQLTGEGRYLQVVDETITYLVRDLRRSGGGFASAEDADSEGEEGRFYVWSLDDVRAVGGDAAVEWWGVTAEGNFEGSTILRRRRGESLLRPPEIDDARERMLAERSERVRPGLDDKVLTEWNAMAVAALAEAGGAANRPDWLDAASETATFLLDSLRRHDGRWMRSWQEGTGPRHLAYAVDHAWLVEAFVRLAEASGEARWMGEARAVADAMLELFWDDEAGGLFTTGHDAERLVVRQKEVHDGATPAAGSVAAGALLRLGGLTGEQRYTAAAEGILHSLHAVLTQQPAAVTAAVAAVDMVVSGLTEIVVTGDAPDLVQAVRSRYLPNAVLAWGEPFESPLWEGRPGDARAAYVCRNYVCERPVTDLDALDALLAPAR